MLFAVGEYIMGGLKARRLQRGSEGLAIEGVHRVVGHDEGFALPAQGAKPLARLTKEAPSHQYVIISGLYMDAPHARILR